MKLGLIISLCLFVLVCFTGCATLASSLGFGDKLKIRVINIDTDKTIEGISLEITQKIDGKIAKKVSNKDGIATFPEIKEANFTLSAIAEGRYYPFDSSYVNYDRKNELLVSLDSLRTIVMGRVYDSLSYYNLDKCYIRTDPATIEVESDSIGNSINFVIKSDLFESKHYDFIANREGYQQVSKNTAITIVKNQRNRIPPILMKPESETRDSTTGTILGPILIQTGQVWDGGGEALDSAKTDGQK